MKLLKKKHFAMLLAIALSHFTFGQDNGKFIYTVKILEITSEESLKNNDASLRPLFDVVGKFNVENQTITFRTPARLTENEIESKLLLQNLHLTLFETQTHELSNTTKN